MSARQSITPDINQGANGGTSAAFGVNLLAGGTVGVGLVAYNSGGAPAVTSITATGCTFTLVREQVFSGTQVRVAIYRAYNVTGGSAPAVTVNMASTCDLDFTVVELDNVTATDSTDASNSATATDAAPTVSVTTVDAAPQMIGVFSHIDGNTALGVGSGYTMLQEAENGDLYMPIFMEYQLFSSSGAKTVNATMGASAAWGLVGASFKSAAGGGGIVIPVFDRQYRQRRS